ncbi:BZ3500_MvSof-1268-A1-R1_Chr8-1g09957 [Microbotryum saponariae]|uniref:BZ3500_MvSof-1268-A1-R1_Chr8-1g09957 protein n=1 Tax=Microbotryum saponariae TaxID=289078 RepID=A0A2X0LAS0_9BASI|nr:BZ3500_MvSof-1268-A1-R1_Chr8-1g09957 [Microbotryum saponariae]SDA08243.1 BZ3501_MvSof-1269-A2-R1_Chr8-1g09680 [Microbotryum saponariae]
MLRFHRAVRPISGHKLPRSLPSLYTHHGMLTSPKRHQQQRRTLFGEPSNLPLAGTTSAASDGIPWLFLLEIGIGFPIVLWTYKCTMMVLFQRKIVNLPFLPLGGRTETLLPAEDRSAQLEKELGGFDWTQVECTSRARSTRWGREVVLRGIQVKLRPNAKKHISSMQSSTPTRSLDKDRADDRPVLIFYLQGNAGTPLHQTTVVAFAPRSYWLSTRSTPTEATFLSDYLSALEETIRLHPKARIILYGHSLGGAAAVLLLLRRELLSLELRTRIKALVLENPLPSIPYMLRAIYPQRWLPYHYLGPCVFDRWDAIAQVDNITEGSEGLKGLKTLWFRSGRDELIPTEQEEKNEGGDRVRRMYEEWKGEDKRWVDIKDALHETAWLSRK